MVDDLHRLELRQPGVVIELKFSHAFVLEAIFVRDLAAVDLTKAALSDRMGAVGNRKSVGLSRRWEDCLLGSHSDS